MRSEVEPGYLPPLLPAEAPDAPETSESVLDDIRSKIMPGELHAYPISPDLLHAAL